MTLSDAAILPLSVLLAAGACQSQYAIVAAEWPDGIPLTEATVARTIELRLDLSWAAWKLLTQAERVEYEQAIAPAEAAYRQAIAPALLAILLAHAEGS